MNLILWWIIVFLILFLFRNKIKNTIYVYVVFLILFYIWSFLLFDIEWKNTMELSAQVIWILPYFILWIWVLIIIFIKDLFNWRKFILKDKEYKNTNKYLFIIIIILLFYFIFEIYKLFQFLGLI